MPQAEHVAELLGFVATCDPTDSVLIHCYAGISRSTAAAYIASGGAPDADEHAPAVTLRQTAPSPGRTGPSSPSRTAFWAEEEG
jgi:predicted protein tyrosine phosphatase